ncbi:DUF6233 domain-containing protein [Streptomyces olindensis]|uniref:DUF6233 domain-containing protein n=1 Tax=Streptomyces olindensis TaxID=358823 RepID=UPI00364E5781
MNDLPPDLSCLRTVETWLILTLDRVRRQIADAEWREEELQRGIAAQPPEPDWLIERGLSGRDAVYVHAGGCWNAGKRSKGVTQEQALHALAEGIKPCPQCEPDNALAFLDID